MSFVRTVTSRGKKYQQLVESKWNPEKKRSEIRVIQHLGSVIKKNGKEILKPSPLRVDSVDKAYPVGKLAIYWKLAEEFKIHDAIANNYGSRGDDIAKGIVILALNQLMGRKALTKLDSWVQNSPLPRWMDVGDKPLTKDFFLSALDNVSKEVDSIFYSHSTTLQMELMKNWQRVVGGEPERYLFFQDITRIEWHGKKTHYAGKGHGACNGKYHVGFGLLVSRDNFMPVMGYPVRGPHHDSTTIKETIDFFKKNTLKKITLVWDRGFVSEKNIDMTREKKIHVLSAGVRSNKEVNEWIGKYTDSEIEQSQNVFPMSEKTGIYFKGEIGELYGHKCKIVVTLDPNKRNHSRIHRDLLLYQIKNKSKKEDIAKIKKKLKPLVQTSRGRKGYKIDTEEEDYQRNCDGRSLFFCTDTRMPYDEIVRTYFQKDHVERAFRHLKGEACLSPVKYQLPGRVEAYLSVVNFIAYELIAGVLWKMREHEIDIGCESLMEEASKIYEVEMTSKGKKVHRWTHMSKEVKKLFKPYGVLDLKT